MSGITRTWRLSCPVRSMLFSPIRCSSSVSKESSALQKPLSKDFEDVTTHTGQKFEEGDYRLARFENREKEVNTMFARDLIAEAPPIPVKDRWVFCEGGDGPLGHPRIFINLDQPGNHSCGYCGLRFFQDNDQDHH